MSVCQNSSGGKLSPQDMFKELETLLRKYEPEWTKTMVPLCQNGSGPNPPLCLSEYLW